MSRTSDPASADEPKGRSELDAEHDLRTMLGDFATSLWLPRLKAESCGAWTLRSIPLYASRGYWGRLYRTEATYMLMGPYEDGKAAWMSIVPMEVESQEIGIASARGHTAVLGLGMGWCAANVALNPAVERVSVVERDPDILALIEGIALFDQLPKTARAKIELVVGDALGWRPDEPVDSLQADIWAKLVEPQKWNDVRRMQDNIGAASIYFWGQELELWRLACRAHGRVPATLDKAELASLVDQTGLPLVLGTGGDHGKRIAEAARWWTPREDGWWDES